MVAVALPVDTGSVAAARDHLRRLLAGRHPDVVEDAALMVSELVTNAIRNTQALLLLEAGVHNHTLRVEVTDDNPAPAILADPSPFDTSGRGLRIVADLADRWGTNSVPGSKTVWFELTVTPL